jgi:hypothetical protein
MSNKRLTGWESISLLAGHCAKPPASSSDKLDLDYLHVEDGWNDNVLHGAVQGLQIETLAVSSFMQKQSVQALAGVLPERTKPAWVFVFLHADVSKVTPVAWCCLFCSRVLSVSRQRITLAPGNFYCTSESFSAKRCWATVRRYYKTREP